MRLVVADTGPLHYLVLIGQIELLPKLFETVFLPFDVQDELSRAKAPSEVRSWIARPPAWVRAVAAPLETTDPVLLRLDRGERAAIILAASRAAINREPPTVPTNVLRGTGFSL